MVLPAGDAVELVLSRADFAPELGWLRWELGTRIFFDGAAGRRPGHWAMEIAAGFSAMRFRPSCGFGPCAQDDWTWGPTIMLGLASRFR